MTIETRYNIGDKVWFMSTYTPICATIFAVEIISVENRGCVIRYTLKSGGNIINKKFEHELFPTKEELLRSL